MRAPARPILRLPQQVADAIAAGEVVERPAAVVKELCENAIDAGAGRIDVRLEGGGLVRIQVVDDGRGIPAAELSSVTSLGFRGEALASIAAVSELRLTSATAGMPGAMIHLRGGVVAGSGPAASARGTSVEVCDLFFNTPARLRFLKSARTESSAAIRAVSDLALAHPQIAFRCLSDERTVLRAAGLGLRSAAAAVFGRNAAEDLLELEPDAGTQALDPLAGDGDIAVNGLLSHPRAHRASRDGLVIIVNGRRVHNRALVVAVEQAYRGLIPEGRHPFGVVAVTLDPSALDVNVHPTKREVRFREERRVFAALERACWHALRRAGVETAGASWSDFLSENFLSENAEAAGATTSPATPPTTPWSELALADAVDGHGDKAAALTTGRDNPTHPGHYQAPPPGPHRAPPELGALRPLRALGQAGSEWLVAASGNAVILVDPHAAHEKVVYSLLLAGWEEKGPGRRDGSQVQLLLMPALVECAPEQIERLVEQSELVASLGFDIEPFGPGLLRCRGVPAACARGDATRLVLDLLDNIEVSSGDEALRRHRLAASMACHSAVRFGDRLGGDEQQNLLDRLVETPGGITCPHGRPAVVVLEPSFLRRVFRRPAAS